MIQLLRCHLCLWVVVLLSSLGKDRERIIPHMDSQFGHCREFACRNILTGIVASQTCSSPKVGSIKGGTFCSVIPNITDLEVSSNI